MNLNNKLIKQSLLYLNDGEKVNIEKQILPKTINSIKRDQQANVFLHENGHTECFAAW